MLERICKPIMYDTINQSFVAMSNPFSSLRFKVNLHSWPYVELVTYFKILLQLYMSYDRVEWIDIQKLMILCPKNIPCLLLCRLCLWAILTKLQPVWQGPGQLQLKEHCLGSLTRFIRVWGWFVPKHPWCKKMPIVGQKSWKVCPCNCQSESFSLPQCKHLQLLSFLKLRFGVRVLINGCS